MSLIRNCILLLILFAHNNAWSQVDSTTEKILSFPGRFIGKVHEKAARLESKLDKQTEKYLLRLAKREQKLKNQLSRVDSNAAKQLFSNSQEEYNKLLNELNTNKIQELRTGQYLPRIDSLKTSLSFLQQNSGILSNVKDVQEKLSGSLKQVSQLQDKLKESEQIKAFIQQRKELIRQTLSKYTQLPKSLSRNFAAFNQDYYYYSQQIKEYKDLLNDPDKLVQKGLDILSRTDAFRRFMQQHSELASLFPMPANYGTSQALAGLQSRAQVQQLVQGQLAAAGPGAQQQLQLNLQTAQTQIDALKDKINKLGGGNSDRDIPDFKPNNQRTKSFFERLEYGTNIQSAKSDYFFPTTTDVGLSLGYKMNDKSIIGIGTSYKIGWGKDIRHIAVTSEGIGLRSFIDIKLKGSFYASGGFEYNYQKPFNALSNIDDLNEWQQSGLAGISKIISLKSKLFKKTKVQLLWDFLSYRQVPQTQAIRFRVGYNF